MGDRSLTDYRDLDAPPTAAESEVIDFYREAIKGVAAVSTAPALP